MKPNVPPRSPAFITLALEHMLDNFTRADLRDHAERQGIPRGRTKHDTALNLINGKAVAIQVVLTRPGYWVPPVQRMT